MENHYWTIISEGTGEYVEKKSRFISTVLPVNSENEAIELISQVKSKYWDARHNCYAYIVEGDTVIQRYSDDGEPSGTAGIPILEIIKKKNLVNVLVIVTRYFGGVLLGASGLVRAYTKSAALGIEDVQPVIRKLCKEINIEVDYNYYGKINNYFINNNTPIMNTSFAENVHIGVWIEVCDVESFKSKIIDMTNGNLIISEGKSDFVTFDIDGNIIF